MLPAARLSAATELLALAAEAGATDREVQTYFRMRRFAGAKDRAAIADLVYLAERAEADLRFLLGEDAPARRKLFASMLLAGRIGMADLEALCTGQGHAPAPLSAEERSALADALARAKGPRPDWVRGAYPPWLEPELKARFGPDLVAETAAMRGRAPLDLRVNRLKADRDDVLAELNRSEITAEPTALSPVGVRLAGRVQLDRLDLYRQGLVEPQDEGSQIAALLVGARPGMLVADLCAGAGGKTLALAAEMAGQGRLIACDAEPLRLKRMKPRLARAGIDNLEVVALDAALSRHQGACDRVLLDVPCSGTGTWRRQPWARWKLAPDDLARDLARQRSILAKGAEMVRPGGRLIYVTCSLLRSENEAQIAGFLGARRDFQPVPAARAWAEGVGGKFEAGGDYVRLTPLRHGTDGFFVAVLERKE